MWARFRKHIRRSISQSCSVCLIVLAATWSAGCSYPDGALCLKLETDRSAFAPDDTIGITATLTANEGDVCMDRPCLIDFDVELRHLDSEHELATLKDRYWICGTGYQPLLGLVTWLDVADTMDRYIVLSDGHPQSIAFQVCTYDGKELRIIDPAVTAAVGHRTPRRPLDPGRYRATATFHGGPKGFYPRPIFWRFYDKPLVASVELEVRPDAARRKRAM